MSATDTSSPREGGQRPHVVIVGGGFGGLHAARGLRRAPVDVTLIDRRNFHLFQPLLYQVAIGGLSPGDVAAPLRGILKRQRNTRVLLADVVDFDLEGRRVILRDGEVRHDYLVVAAGMMNHYFGNQGWERIAPGLKSIEDATEIRSRILHAFEAAERETDPESRRALLTFVIVGGGPTGVELAGAVAELARDTLRPDFRSIDPGDAVIYLVEGGPRILPSFPPGLSEKAVRSLQRLGVTVLLETRVTALREGEVEIGTKDKKEIVRSRTILWAAGVRASPLGEVLARRAGVKTDRMGRIPVEPDLSLPGHPDVFVIGDLAICLDEKGKQVPGVAPAAMQEGDYVARRIVSKLEGEAEPPFRYHDKGNLATIGRGAAVAEIGRFHFSGFLAWIVWLLVHILHLVGFENRVLVLTQWAWNYITWNRSARLITGNPPVELPPPGRPS
jgi:NADH dehydrogenase